MIWQFQNTNVYVLGSVHVMAADQNAHLNSIDSVFDIVSRVIFETSLDIGDLPITRYKNDQLSANISTTLFRDTKKIWLKYGLPLSELDYTKIWYVALLISMKICSASGLDYENGVDKIIWKNSKNVNKDIEWLENQSAGLMCFHSSPKEEQIKFLTETVRNKRKVIDSVKKIIDGWNSGSEAALLNILHTSLEEYPIMYRNLIIERNFLWVPAFLKCLNTGTPTLFVVGALHCVGEYSILNILKKDHGYPSNLINIRS